MIKMHIDEKTQTLKYAINFGKETVCEIPDGVKIIGKGAFSNNHSFKTIIIPPSVIKIEERAFINCDQLESITIPNSVELVGDYAFAGCSKLLKLHCNIQKTVFGYYCFSRCRWLQILETDDDIARVFYFPASDQFAITKYVETVGDDRIEIYAGRFSPKDLFPLPNPIEGWSLCYFVTLGDYSWFGNTKEAAITGIRFAAHEKTLYNHYKQKITLNTVIGVEDFSLITGVCVDGIEIFLKSKGKPKDWRAPVHEIIDLMIEEMPGACERFLYALENQETELNFININNLLTFDTAKRKK